MRALLVSYRISLSQQTAKWISYHGVVLKCRISIIYCHWQMSSLKALIIRGLTADRLWDGLTIRALQRLYSKVSRNYIIHTALQNRHNPCRLKSRVKISSVTHSRRHSVESIPLPRHNEIGSTRRVHAGEVGKYLPLYQYSRTRPQWPRSTWSQPVRVWRHLQPTSIRNMIRITSVSDIAVFVLKRDVKLQTTNFQNLTNSSPVHCLLIFQFQENPPIIFYLSC